MRKNAYGGEPQRKYEMPNIYSSPEKNKNQVKLQSLQRNPSDNIKNNSYE